MKKRNSSSENVLKEITNNENEKINNEDIEDNVVNNQETLPPPDLGTLLIKTAQENQTRKILAILNECISLSDARKKIAALLPPTDLPVKNEAHSQHHKSATAESNQSQNVIKVEGTPAKTLRVEEACQRYSLGKTTMRETAKKAGAVVRVGKCFLINVSIMDDYLDSITDMI